MVWLITKSKLLWGRLQQQKQKCHEIYFLNQNLQFFFLLQKVTKCWNQSIRVYNYWLKSYSYVNATKLEIEKKKNCFCLKLIKKCVEQNKLNIESNTAIIILINLLLSLASNLWRAFLARSKIFVDCRLTKTSRIV